MRNSSVPTPTTEPTVALREEITPLSGAVTWVYFRRSCCDDSAALAEAMRARAVASAVMYWPICWADKAPEDLSVCARAALATASAAVASASSSAARACATSAFTLSAENTASTCPFFTLSPTLTRTSVRRSPPDSLPMIASCHAATLPLAASLIGRLAAWARVLVTVSAGLTGAAFLSSAAFELAGAIMTADSAARTPRTRAGRGFRSRFFILFYPRFDSMTVSWR